jgi:hypothetical protein
MEVEDSGGEASSYQLSGRAKFNSAQVGTELRKA